MPRSETKRQLTAVIYVRQSRTRESSASIATQKAACRKAAKTFGAKVVREIEEPHSTSAYKDRGRARPRFPELLELVRSGAVNVVIVYMSDRLSRGGGPGWAPLWDAVEASGADIDLDRFVLTPDGYKSEFELGIRATMDREESKKISDRLVSMKEYHATDGRPSGGGYRAFGYEADRMTIDEAEADILRELVARYLSGEGTRSLARWLNAAGHRTTRGGEWTGGVVLNLIRNPRNAGLRVHKGEIVGDAAWPAILDRPTWERLSARIGSRARGPGQSKTSKYLLQQVITCGRCGGRMNGAPVAGRERYRCQKAPGRVNCGATTIACGPVDDLVVEMLLYRLGGPVMADALAGRTRATDAHDVDLSEQIIACEKRLDEVVEMYGAGEIDRKALVTLRRRYDDELQQIRARIVRNEQTVAIASFIDDGQDPAALWADAPQGRRQQILRAVIDRVLIGPATVRGSKTVDVGRVDVQWRV